MHFITAILDLCSSSRPFLTEAETLIASEKARYEAVSTSVSSLKQPVNGAEQQVISLAFQLSSAAAREAAAAAFGR